ncbi:MAG TPA: CarD family transcriptional regulator [Bacillota bacterium]|nr:CarD family transcriptional regulator [Bacillota bacterium]
MLFRVGDKVVYPMHGAGIIEAIEEKEVLGEKRKYYIMRLPIGNMKVMVPISNGTNLGLREIIDAQQIDQVIDVLGDRADVVSTNWSLRYRQHLEKIKSGNVFEVAEVVRNLSLREREKGLSTGERKMLDTARQILISELSLATNDQNIEGMLARVLG